MNEKVMRKIAEWRNDPVLFVRECFKADPDRWQRKVLEAYGRGATRIAMQACVGPGKTCVLAWMGWHFQLTHPHSQIAVTSVSEANLKDGLWKELATWRTKSQVLQAAFEQTATRIYAKDHPATWFISYRTWSKSASADQMSETLRGLHADNIMFILDEAGGIPDAVAVTAEAVLSTVEESCSKKDARLLIAGNPTRLAGPLYRAATKEEHLWTRFEITGDPDDPNRASRVSKKWAQQMIDNFGRDHPWVLVNVFGRFPPGKFNALIALDDARAAEERDVPANWISHEPRVLGIDVARAGEDRSVIFPRQGRVAQRPLIFRVANIVDLAGHIIMAMNKWKPHATFLDGDGWGSSVGDVVRSHGYDVIDLHGSGNATASDRYANKRTENWARMADWIRRGGCIPYIEGLRQELTAVEYIFDSKNRIQLVPKRETADELGRSPDLADALAYTFASPVAIPSALGTKRVPRAETEYNHLEAP